MEDPGRLRRHARDIWMAGLDAVRAGPLVKDALHVTDDDIRIGGREIPRERVSSVTIVGAGKAGADMAEAAERVLSDGLGADVPIQGWVNVPDETVRALEHVHLHAARQGHDNLPSEAGVDGAERILSVAGILGPRDLLLCLWSGGASSLLPCPAEGIRLADKRAVTSLLHARGASIEEVNAVRKHLSRIKGGRLADAARRGHVASLIVSDVVGDPLDVIASGPTAPDPSTFEDAWCVLETYELIGDPAVPAAVIELVERGLEGAIDETPFRVGEHVSNHVIGANRDALRAAAERARGLGYRVVDLSSYVEGETAEVGVMLASLARGVRHEGSPAAAPACVIMGGETTVTLGESPGKGGRNQELVLSALVHLGRRELRDALILSAGTDGEDGPTDAAGAFADLAVLDAAMDAGFDPIDHLERHDAHPFFEAGGGLFQTGWTGTNVMDLRVLLVGAP
jgi:glycerate 2-kinase